MNQRLFKSLTALSLLAMPVFGQDTPPPARCPKECSNFFVTADFLWWKAEEQNLAIAFLSTNPGADPYPDGLTSLDIGKVVRLDFSWDPGFRVGMGWNTPYDGWDVCLDWTWYLNQSIKKSSHPVEIGNSEGLYSVWLRQSGTNTASFVHGKWNMHLNLLDLELGRKFLISKKLSARPFVSLEGGWLNRSFAVEYGYPDPLVVMPDIPGSYNAKNDLWGVGPRGGVNTNWKICDNFKFIGNFAYSLLYGQAYDNKAKSVQTLLGTPNQVTASIDDSNIWFVTPHLQSLVGLGWGKCMRNDRTYLGIELGWEVNYFWNIPRFVLPRAQAQSLSLNSTDLSLVGLTLDVKLDF